MRIAHINNPSGIATDIAEEQRRLGHEVDIFVFNKIIFSQFGGIKYRYWSPVDRWKFFKKLKGYDVWHYHYPYGSLRRSLEKRNSGKIYLRHYHGNDLRSKKEEDFCLVSTPDLLRYAPKGKWLPVPINLSEIMKAVHDLSLEKIRERDNRKVKVAHYPYYKNYSASDYYSEVLNNLEKDGKCTVINILQQRHSQALRLLSSSDVVIGKIMPDVGWFGKFELEGMTLGKSVIAYVSNELYEKYRPPIYTTTKSTFRSDLLALIENGQERKRLSIEGPKYITKNHSLGAIVRTVMACYNMPFM